MPIENYKIETYNVEDHYKNKFSRYPEVVIKSPGRINVIGEHTDYNDGYVLPAAINYYMYVAVSKNNTNKINLYSIDYDESHSCTIEGLKRGESGWANLIYGVVKQLVGRVEGIDLAFGGNIPEGAGVSSSAALCCGVGMALSELFDLKMDKWQLAKVAQKSEHEFALVQCGIMDQFACLFGLTNHVLLLDCKSLEYKESEIDMGGYKFILLNSNVKHSLGDSDYNLRKIESTTALDIFKARGSKVATYQDATLKLIDELKSSMPVHVWKRAFHIVSENYRVEKVNAELKAGNYETVGNLLTEGHNSLKNYYEVTCLETDFIVNELNKHPNVLGARQVGGGFGGCVLALVKDADINRVVGQVALAYKKSFNLKLDDIPIKISRGCHRIN